MMKCNLGTQTNTRPVIRHGKRARRPHLQQPGAGALAGPMPTWTSFMLEIASSELGIRGTAGLPNLAASPKVQRDANKTVAPKIRLA
jgi:hypothetical protein